MWPDLGAVRDGIIFNLLNMFGGILWTLDRIMMMVSGVLHWFRVLLVGGGGQDNLLGILMTQLLQGNDFLKHLVYLGLMLAFTVLSFTLIARPIIGRFQAVELNKVILWFFFAIIIFSAGPGMASGLESTRLGLQEQAHLIASTIQYQNEVNRFNNQVVPNTVGDFWLPGQTPGNVPHLFGTSVGSDCPSGCSGLDAAAAFLGAEEGDITGARAEAQNTGGYPQALYDRYFTWRDGNEEERSASLRNASEGVMRLLEGILPSFFSIIEALIFLLFGIAALVLFISLPAAIPFAFFSLTEVIAASVVRAYLFLVVRTYVVATMMAFLVQMLIIFAERGTVLVFVSIAALTMILSFQFVHMAASTVTAALNVIGSAVGSATGVSARQTDPLAAAGRVAGMAAVAGAAVATGGGAVIGAATLLHRQGGLRGGGLSAVGSAALHAARVRAGAVVGRTPLKGLQRGYSAVQGYHQQSREHTYQLESARALLLDRDAEEAAAILMDQKNSASPVRKDWAARKVREWTTLEGSRQKYRQDMRGAGMGRLAYRGYSRPWKALNGVGAEAAEVSTASAQSPHSPQSPRHEPTTHASDHSDAGYSGYSSDSNEGAPNRRGGSGSASSIARMDIQSITSHSSQWALDLETPRAESGPSVSALLPFTPGDMDLRALVDDSVLTQNSTVGIVSGYVVVYGGTHPEDDLTLGSYEIVPGSSDILSLLQKGKHVQKSSKHPDSLLIWEPGKASINPSLPAANAGTAVSAVPEIIGLTMWSGADSLARQRTLSDMRQLADKAGRGLPLNAQDLRGKLPHLSRAEKERLAHMLEKGSAPPQSIVHLLEETNRLATELERSGLAGENGESGESSEWHTLISKFVTPEGYLDLDSRGVSAIVAASASQGNPVRIRTSSAQDGTAAQGIQGIQGTQGIPAADIALLVSAGLGLKRAVPWAQVKGALVHASLSDSRDPVESVSESLGASSLRSSMAPTRRFVDAARQLDLPAGDLTAILDVSSAAHDTGGVISALSEKDQTKRHAMWSAAGVPRQMIQPLERARANALANVDAFAIGGTSDQRARERAEGILGTLLAEGAAISDELYSAPIETYSAHPFTIKDHERNVSAGSNVTLPDGDGDGDGDGGGGGGGDVLEITQASAPKGTSSEEISRIPDASRILPKPKGRGSQLKSTPVNGSAMQVGLVPDFISAPGNNGRKEKRPASRPAQVVHRAQPPQEAVGGATESSEAVGITPSDPLSVLSDNLEDTGGSDEIDQT